MQKSKLKRRLRKKFHLGEFQESGFEVSCKFKWNLNQTELNSFIDEFIDKIEENKLLVGGGGGSEIWSGFITSQEKYCSPTEKQREKIRNWLENRLEIAESEVGNFVDAWYDSKLKN